MTNITYKTTDDVLWLTISGHAGYSTIGSDIVCAGISAIGYALIGYLGNHPEITSGYKERSGLLEVRCEAHDKAKEAFEMALIGLMQIARNYPDNVKVNISAQGGDSREETAENERSIP